MVRQPTGREGEKTLVDYAFAVPDVVGSCHHALACLLAAATCLPPHSFFFSSSITRPLPFSPSTPCPRHSPAGILAPAMTSSPGEGGAWR